MTDRWETVSTGVAAGDRSPKQQERWKRAIGVPIAGLLALTLVACSKTVRWEEEVPLNTGETIWVTRTATYSLQNADDNPLKFGYRLDWEETLSFKWRDRSYVYEGDADLMLLAISPKLQPVLVAPAGNKSWDWKHDYRCATPHYVQLMPDAGGRKWTWPSQIEPWLYGLPANLLAQRKSPEDMKSRYTALERDQEDAIGRLQSPIHASIDSSYVSKHCKGRD